MSLHKRLPQRLSEYVLKEQKQVLTELGYKDVRRILSWIVLETGAVKEFYGRTTKYLSLQKMFGEAECEKHYNRSGWINIYLEEGGRCRKHRTSFKKA